MGRMAKTRKNFRMSQRRKYTDTKPEKQFKTIIDEWKFPYIHPYDLTTKYWENPFHIDFYVTLDPPRAVEVDGPYHNTEIQLRKSIWRDECLIKSGLVVIHIPIDMLDCNELMEVIRLRIQDGKNLPLKDALKML